MPRNRATTYRIERFLAEITALPGYAGQAVHVRAIPERPARYGQLEHPLQPALRTALQAQGIDQPYSHQAQAVNAVRAGEHVVVATSTASGKTLCYNLPVIDSLLADPHSRALYLFPTKALAQDQLRNLRELTASGLPDLRCETFDGDTAAHLRPAIKRSAHVVLSNPDMLHLGILPHHATWSAFLRRLRYVVVDEAHAYRGVFGSHVGNVLRRLRRLCANYGSRPQFICCSATIANPGEHVSRLTGLPHRVVDEDGSPHGSRQFVFWNPPPLDQGQTARRSANSEATFLFAELARRGIRAITFTRTRRLAELIYLYAREELAQRAPQAAERIRAYRAGYLAADRRAIERGLFDGELLGVTSTTALELGVDIGDLEATVLTGYPGSIASTWQQAGRAGRGRGHSLAFLIGLDGPLDQYLMRHPEAFFAQSPENALIDPGNPHVLGQHLLCAAYEMALGAADRKLFGEGFAPQVQGLVEEGHLRARGERWYLSAEMDYPAKDVNIRSTATGSYQVVDTSRGNQVLETVDAAVALSQLHRGAIYLHQGESYLVRDLDLPARTAYAAPVEATYYTQAREVSDLRIVRSRQTRTMAAASAYLGEVRVSNQVVGYKRKRQFTDEVIGEEALDLPVQSFETVALWFDVPEAIERQVNAAGLDFQGGLHAVEHAAIGLLPLFAMCDRQDIGGLSTPLHVDTGRPQVFVYDAHPGGVGIAERGFALLEELWRRTLEVVSECPCEDGCPSCIQSPKCGNNNEPLDKEAARMILSRLLTL